MTGFVVEWGGHEPARMHVNVFEWFWAIAEGGRPCDLTPADIAFAMTLAGRPQNEAADVIARAACMFDSRSLDNRRRAEWQSCERETRKALRTRADKLGIRTTGWDTKAELTRAIVDRMHPMITKGATT